jgi:1-pyrroline-5-carboxylate dehydrogenase
VCAYDGSYSTNATAYSRTEARPIDGFVYAVTPFNFTALAVNLVMAPIIMGNVVIWKPSPGAIYSNWLFHQIMMEAGLPPGVLQFIPGNAEVVTAAVYESRDLGGLHFTGSTEVFRSLSSKIGTKMSFWRSYPRIVGETGSPRKPASRRAELMDYRWQELPSHSSQC